MLLAYRGHLQARFHFQSIATALRLLRTGNEVPGNPLGWLANDNILRT